VRLSPQFLRALHLELFTKPSFRWLFTSSSILGEGIFYFRIMNFCVLCG